MTESHAAPLPQVAAKRSRLADLIDRATHPIVLKELRQASRGAFLLRAMLVVQMLAFALASITLLLDASDLERSEVGLRLFMVAIGCGILATCAVVPFFGFLSLGAERELATLDLLHLTRLRPSSIVFGKLAACFVLTLEFCASLAPLVVLAYLLPGLDLRVVLTAIVAMPLASLVLTACAIGLSGIVTSRLGRALASVVLIIGLFLIGLYGFFGYVAMMQFGGFTGFDDLLAVVSGTLLVLTMFAIVLLSAALVPLTHFEENRALPPRLAMLLLATIVIAGVASFAATTGVDAEAVAALQVYSLTLMCLAGVPAMTEAERLPKRVAATVPRSRFLALLRAPLCHGGAFGLLWFIGCALFQIVGSELAAVLFSPASRRATFSLLDDASSLGPLGVLGYALVFFAPLAAVGQTSDRLAKRTRLRVWMFFAPVLTLFVAVVYGFATDGPRGAERKGESPWNPFWLIAELSDDPRATEHVDSLAVVLVIATVAVALNLPRIARAFHGLLAASAARREAPA
jgi:hypothetical protein